MTHFQTLLSTNNPLLVTEVILSLWLLSCFVDCLAACVYYKFDIFKDIFATVIVCVPFCVLLINIFLKIL